MRINEATFSIPCNAIRGILFKISSIHLNCSPWVVGYYLEWGWGGGGVGYCPGGIFQTLEKILDPENYFPFTKFITKNQFLISKIKVRTTNNNWQSVDKG